MGLASNWAQTLSNGGTCAQVMTGLWGAVWMFVRTKRYVAGGHDAAKSFIADTDLGFRTKVPLRARLR